MFGKIATAAALAALLVVTTFTGRANAQTSYPAPLACWSMDETTGPRIDASGNGYHLTENNTVGYVGGVTGNAANFTRVNSEWLSITGGISLADNTAWSVSMWLYLDSVGSYPSLYSKSAYGTRVFIAGGTAMKIYNDAGSQVEWSQIFNTGTWYHVVIVSDGNDTNNIRLYINGSDIGTRTLADSSQSINLIGAISLPAMYYHDGKIDEAVIFSTSLSSAQVAGLYNSGSGLSCTDIIAGVQPPTPTPAASLSHVYTSTLPVGGGVGTVTMDMTAGDAGIIIGIALVVLLLFFEQLSSWILATAHKRDRRDSS